MGTKVQSKSYLPGYHSMRDLNEASNSINWPIFHGDKTLSNGQYYSGFVPGIADAYAGYDKDVVKRTMLEHEAIFKNQVYELHRVYRIQRDLMNEIKRKELQKNRIPLETSLSSSPLASQVTSEDARKWSIPGFPLSNSISARPTVSGAEDMHSHFSPLKGHSAQGCSFPSQNGSSSKSKDIEVLESRPTKVRRRMFDLHLPAEEYIDTEEGVPPFRDRKASEMSSCIPDKNHDIAPEGRVKLFLDDAGKNGCERDASRSDSSLRSTNGLADLNEPFLVEETHAPAYVDLLSSSSHREVRGGHELSAKPDSQFLGVAKEMLVNSRSSNGNNVNLYMDNNGNGKVWFPHVPETGQSKSIVKSASQGFHPGKLPLPSQPVQTLFNKTHEPPIFRTDQSKIDLCRERTSCGLSTSGTSGDASTYNHPDSFMTSRIMHPAAPSPDLVKSWSQSVLSWEKPNSILSQRSMPVQSHPSFNLSSTLSNISHTPSQSHENFGANLGFRKEFPNQNGFYHGSSSGSKESQVPRSSGSHDYPNCNSGNGVPDLFATHGSSKYFNSSNCVKPAKGMDLNMVLSTSSSNEAASLHGDRFADGERNHKDHFVGLPWLRSKPGNKNGATNSGRDLNNWESSFVHSATRHSDKQFSQNMQSLSSSNDVAAQSVGNNADRLNNKKILGFPIFEKPRTPEKECSLTSPLSLPRLSETVETKKSRLFDMNLPCDAVFPDSSIEKRMMDEKVSAFRCLIDLNSCLSEDEASIAPFGSTSKVKTVIQIDLEVPAVPETEENAIQGEENHEEKSEHDKLAKIAAEAIIDISSFVHKSHADTSTPDPLSWFVDIASSYGDDIEEIRSNKDSSSEVEEVDFFECMTLKLAETKEDEYMPAPPVIDSSQAEETGGGLLTARPRRGQARRGRQRRDFQRDILPGLVSLSRHEVTEDLQMFGGIMRATGHSWQSGMGRRSGGGRGRRRAPVAVAAAVSTCTMLQVNNNNMEVGVEERSLTGWGKTIRRPRRQRCPAGNPQSLLLS